MQLDSKIETLPRITKPQIAALKKLEVLAIRDLLFHFPYRYLDFSKVASIPDLKAGEAVTLKVNIKQISSRFSFKSHLSLAEAVVSDGSGSLKIVWFNQSYIAKALKTGDEVYLAGTPEYYNNGLQLTNPLYEKVSDLAYRQAGFPIHTARLVPVYHLTEGIYPRTLRNMIALALPLATTVPESLPQDILKTQNLLSLPKTIRQSHFPQSLEQVEQAKKRLAFEEIFLNQLLAQKHKLELAQKKAYSIGFDQPLVKSFIQDLPFELTPGQKKATWEILQDLEKTMPMNRLLEADVGSGKTLVAFIACLETVKQNLQATFMAPTEILSRQHYATAQKFFKNQSIKLILLTNNFSEIDGTKVAKTKLQKLILEGMPGLYFGTQALLAKKVNFKNLALTVIDEQHRFGVDQRAALIRQKHQIPHLLSLTATPIPRTMQLAAFGELDVSQIKSKPANRKPIFSKLVPARERQKAYEFIDHQLKQGRQAFVITPLIEENATLDVKSAKKEYANLQKIFPQYNIGLLHGKMSSRGGATTGEKNKEQVMADFLANKIQILVSTSVVEVGVVVPNASVMVIEGAERFGLAQLHQFRGRVGRSEYQSYCLLFTETENPESISRLQEFTKIQDGFTLAELDLKQRGFGEIYGAQQSGWNFKYFNPFYINLIEPARQEAIKLLKFDSSLIKYPTLSQAIIGKIVHFE